MLNWWSSLTGLEQVMACIAIPATIMLIVQTVLILFTAFGGDGDIDGDFDTDIDTDVDADNSDFGGATDGIQIFTLKGIISFFSIFGWSGLLFLRMDLNEILSLIIAFVLGALSMLAIGVAFSAMMKLQDSGNIDTKTALGVNGVVYINIPKNRTGMGKVSAIVSGRYSEYDAVTDDENDLATGSQIIVVAISSPNVLVVAKK